MQRTISLTVDAARRTASILIQEEGHAAVGSIVVKPVGDGSECAVHYGRRVLPMATIGAALTWVLDGIRQDIVGDLD